MDEKEALLKEIEDKTQSITRLNMRVQIFTEIIAHLRSRVSSAETKKREIHHEIVDLRARVQAWLKADKKLCDTETDK